MYLPYHTVNAGVTITPWRPVGITLAARYAGSRTAMDNDVRRVVELDPYTVVDLTCRGEWGGFTAEVGTYNLLDEEYQETHGYPMPRRSYLVTISHAF